MKRPPRPQLLLKDLKMKVPENSLLWKMVQSHGIAYAEYKEALRKGNAPLSHETNGRMMGIEECIVMITGRAIATALLNREKSIVKEIHDKQSKYLSNLP